MSIRFDYLPWDEVSAETHGKLRVAFEAAESLIDALAAGRAKALALTALEESYMWVGKAIRDDQVTRSK